MQVGWRDGGRGRDEEKGHMESGKHGENRKEKERGQKSEGWRRGIERKGRVLWTERSKGRMEGEREKKSIIDIFLSVWF